MTSQATNQRVITEERVATLRATQLGKNHPEALVAGGRDLNRLAPSDLAPVRVKGVDITKDYVDTAKVLAQRRGGGDSSNLVSSDAEDGQLGFHLKGNLAGIPVLT